jgi:hypothetical protein
MELSTAPNRQPKGITTGGQFAPSTNPEASVNLRADSEHDRISSLYAQRVCEQDAQRPGYEDEWDAMVKVILAHGGELVTPPMYVDKGAKVFTTRGHVQTGKVMMKKGEPRDCHNNVIAMFRAGRVDGIGTGYALSDDGLWRSHSWGVRANGTIIETTERRCSYFGVTLVGTAAETFCAN